MFFFNVFVLLPTLISFYIRTKDHLYFRYNNNENGWNFRTSYVTIKRQIRKIRASGPGCSGI
jgi:hypothetical protein